MRFSLWLVLVGVAVVLVCGVTRADKPPADEGDVEDEDFDADDVEEVVEDNETPVKTTEEDQAKLNERPEYKQPKAKGNTYFTETFHTPMNFEKRWVKSQAKKDDTDDAIAKYDGEWKLEEPKEPPMKGEDLGLVLKSKAKHHAIAAKLDKTYEFNEKPFVMQYEVKFQDGQECGGAYVKLLTQDKSLDLKNLKDKTGYTIMFGPDKCGNDNKLHFIFRHKHPVTGEFEEKHAKKPTSGIDGFFTDKKTHLFTLVINPDNTWEVLVDQELVNSGSLLEDMEPPVNPPKEIIDPDDKKPLDWDEREKIPDPDASKPEDWDETQPEKIPDADAAKPDGWLDEEPELVADPDAERPSDWDEDMDGAWEAPLINNPKCESAPGCGEWKRPEVKNPKYKGKWKAPLIENPSYKGKWVPRKIPNPEYFEDKQPYKMSSISAIGLELWSMSSDLLFDNFIITDNKQVADQFASDSWELKYKQELTGGSSGRSVVQAVLDVTKDRPWLWAVFIIVIVLPIVLIIAYCCMPSKADDVAQYKKTDEAQPDSKEETAKSENKEEDDVDEDETDDKEDGAGDMKKASPKKSADAKKPSKSDLDAEEENQADEEEEAEETEEQTTRSSPRKRKTRARKD